MKIVRSILGVVVGTAVAMVVMMAIEWIGGLVFPRPPELEEEMRRAMEGKSMNREKIYDLMQTMPTGAIVMVLLAWELGAFVGAAMSAWIAGRAHRFHAGIIGAVVLAATVAMVLMLPGHPDWMIIAGLLLPMPVSLLAGKIVAMRFPEFHSPTESNP